MKGFSKGNLILLYEAQKGRCAYCGCSLLEVIKDGKSIQFDHIEPKSKNGNDELKNLCLVCSWCNSVKRDKSMEEFMQYLKPYLERIVKDKKDLREYHQYKKLSIKFKGLE